MFVIVFSVLHVIQGYSYGDRHEAQRPRRSVDAIISVVDSSVQEFGVFATNQIEIIGDDLQLLEQDLVQIFTDIADAQLEKTSILVNHIGSLFSDNEVSMEQESNEVSDNEEETNQDRNSQSRKKKILLGTKVVSVPTIAKTVMARVNAIIKKLILKKKASSDSVINAVDEKRQGVQEFVDSVQSPIQFSGDDLLDRVPTQEVDGCRCSDFTFNLDGILVGACISENEERRPFCYVNQPNSCKDSKPSTKFFGMSVSADACTSSLA